MIMDISFHYFAVKTVAQAVGYNESRAQRIAEFSQFIDDYNWYSYFRATNIPKYIKGKELDIVFNELASIVNPVTTGFFDWIDLATLVLPRSQKFTVSPFHFIPQDKKSREANDYRAVPATINDNSYISNMLNQAKSDMKSGNLSDSDALMKIGMLLHTFADTYAHQLFTGYNNLTNSVELTNATDNITGKDVTKDYQFWIDTWNDKLKKILGSKIPTIGHMAIAHVPDLTHLSFSMKYKGLDGRSHIHSRSNTSTFVTACSEIYNFLSSCMPDGSKPLLAWDDLSPKLADGFLLDASKELEKSEKDAVNVLTAHWSKVFPDFSYHYSNESIKNRFMSKTLSMVKVEPVKLMIEGEEMAFLGKEYSDEFYRYNYFADKHLIELYGAHPRNLLSESEVLYNNIQSN